MIIDISSCNGKIDFTTLAGENIERVILRGTTQNGNLDVRLIENINGICSNMPNAIIDVYKFSYARNYENAAIEAYNLLGRLNYHGLLGLVNTIWLDLEGFGGRSHTKDECAKVIAAYAGVMNQFNRKWGVYCNYNYLKNILPLWLANTPIWLARWGSVQIGDVEPFTVTMWQYTSKGKVNGITTDVDLSRYVKV